MDAKTMSERWQERSREISTQVAQWRVGHPTATLAEIEQAVDEQVSSLRAQMIEEAAQASLAAEGRMPSQEPRTCPECGSRMQARGRQKRRLQTQGGREVVLTRRYLNCPHCGYSFSPLDKELDLPAVSQLSCRFLADWFRHRRKWAQSGDAGTPQGRRDALEIGKCEPDVSALLRSLNHRLNEEWQEQHHWNQQRRHQIRKQRFQKRRALQESKREALRVLVHPPVVAVKEEVIAPKKSGRTPAQHRWGRQTFSPRMLRQGS